MSVRFWICRTATSRSGSSKRSLVLEADERRKVVGRVFRSSRGRLVAALTRQFGAEHVTQVEGALQEASLRALERGIGAANDDQTEGWLLRVACNVLVDALRHERRNRPLPGDDALRTDPPTPEVEDELRLVFLSCHPTLPRAAQIALTLRIAYGLSTSQIARAFLCDERTVAQRIVRAKQRLRDEKVSFVVPEPEDLPARLDAILAVLYSLFAEGYATTDTDKGVDDALCGESLRLSRVLTDDSRWSSPAGEAPRALFCFHAARSAARRSDDGGLLLLHEQDRSRWDAALFAEGFVFLERGARGNECSRYHLEAGIAACHAAAASHAATDWGKIVELYDGLRELSPSPVVDVNGAFAVGMHSGTIAGLDELDSIPERDILARYPYALAIYAEFHAAIGQTDSARKFLERALVLQTSPAERALLLRKRAALELHDLQCEDLLCERK